MNMHKYVKYNFCKSQNMHLIKCVFGNFSLVKNGKKLPTDPLKRSCLATVSNYFLASLNRYLPPRQSNPEVHCRLQHPVMQCQSCYGLGSSKEMWI